MAATFNWCEDYGAATGSPSRGTTRKQNSEPPTDVSWKNAADAKTASSGTLYSAAPIVAGTNSYSKLQYGQFSGSFNQILNGKWSARTAPSGALATGLTLHGQVRDVYTVPATTADSGMNSAVNYTAAEVAVASGTAVEFNTTGPENLTHAATLSAAGFTQYLITQLQTSGSAAPGDMAQITTSLQYNEN